MVALLGHVGTLSNSMLTYKLHVSLLFDLFPVVVDLELLRNDSNALASIEGRVRNLSLERESFEVLEVNL